MLADIVRISAVGVCSNRSVSRVGVVRNDMHVGKPTQIVLLSEIEARECIVGHVLLVCQINE